MLVRAFCSLVAVFYFGVAYAAECNYSEQNGFLSRVVAIDSTGGPVYRTVKEGPGTPSTPSPLELHEKEVVLVFDQGPNSGFTRYILDILDRRCAKAVFFFAGNAALSNPDNVREAARRGHTVAAGPWSTAPNLAALPGEGAKAEIEKGFAAVAKASGGEVAPFFSAPGQSIPPATLDYLKERGVSLWPVDVVSGDLEPGLTPSKLANRTLDRLREAGKGILEFHDTSRATVDALDSILVNMKASGFKLVQILQVENFAAKAEFLAAPAKPAPGGLAVSPASGDFIEEAKRQVRADEARQAQRRQIAGARQEAAGRRARQEAAERRERQEAAEHRARARYAEQPDRLYEERQGVAERREAAERRARARYADRTERRTMRVRQEAAERRARQEAAERRAQARSAGGPERRRTAQRPD